MGLEIHKPGDRRFSKGLIFSPTGHGKTHLLGTAQADDRTYPMLLMDFEGGAETLAGLDIDVAPIRDWGDYNEAYELLSDKDCIYNSLGIDSISETHIWALLERIGEKGPTRKDPHLIEQGDYGVVGTQLRRLLREFRDLPMHCFYTGAAKDDEEKGVGKIKVPALAGQMSSEAVHLVSWAGYLAKGAIMNDQEEEEIVRSLFLDMPGYRVKVRTKWGTVAPPELENPTITSILDMLEIPMPKGKKK